MTYQPKTGQRCTCRPGIWRDNCPQCEGTGWRIDFAAIRARRPVDPQCAYSDQDVIERANRKDKPCDSR